MASNLTEYLVLFYVYSLLGWCMEMVYCGIREHRLVNRGFLLGPCCPIYGVGMVTITVLFQHARFGFAAVFVMIIVFCTALEYAASVVMEHFFHTRGWDYNDMKFNIHGRVCMETMLPFGLLGMLCAVSCQSVFPTALSHCAVQHFPQDRHRTGADDTDRSAGLCFRAARALSSGGGGRSHRRDLTAGS